MMRPDSLTFRLIAGAAIFCVAALVVGGIALSAIHDRAFDRGFISLDENLKVLVSSKLKSAEGNLFLRVSLIEIEGSKLRPPLRYPPAKRSLEYHRDVVFVN